MSWNVSLWQGAEVVDVPSHQEGGIIAIGGNTGADMSVTYNYSGYYYEYLDSATGLKWLDGRQAKSCIERLESAVVKLGDKQDEDYWAKTPGNAGHALVVLLGWAKLYPEAVFQVH